MSETQVLMWVPHGGGINVDGEGGGTLPPTHYGKP